MKLRGARKSGLMPLPSTSKGIDNSIDWPCPPEPDVIDLTLEGESGGPPNSYYAPEPAKDGDPEAAKPETAAFKEVQCKMAFVTGNASSYVKLNVGGHLFQTTLGVLCRYDSMLRKMFSGLFTVRQDDGGYVLIDRSGKHFDKVLNFLRDGTVPLPKLMNEVVEVSNEAQYYMIQELVDLCNSWLFTLQQIQSMHGITGGATPLRILVANSDIEVKEIARTYRDLIVIEWLLNRKNTMYPFTPDHSDAVVKNFELFIRLVQNFNSRAIFVFNYGTGTGESCRWTFYLNGGDTIFPVQCTQLVNSSNLVPSRGPGGAGNLLNKIDCPEAQIYQYTTDVLLQKLSILTNFANP